MGGLLDTLLVGGNALQAQQVAAQATGSNVGNANAPGYHRVDVAMNPGGVNGGIQNAQLTRAANGFLEAAVNAQTGSKSFADAHVLNLSPVVTAVGDLSASGINGALSDFFGAWRTLSTSPQDLAARTSLLTRASTLAGRIQTAAQNLQTAQKNTDTQVGEAITDANATLQTVAQLNASITAAEANGQVASALRDQRDVAVNSLAATFGATSATDSNGKVTVMIGGLAVVMDDSAVTLAPSTDAVTGLTHITIANSSQGVIDDRVTSGTVGALLQVRDRDITATQTSLDQLAADITTAVNTIHSAGYGLDAQTGRDLFAQHATAGAALAMALDPSVAGNPNAVSAAASPNASGDNSVAAQMVGLESELVAQSSTQTLGQSVANLINQVGVASNLATAAQSQQTTYLQQAQALWQTQNGVSLQDQMLQLTSFQNAYQAATRVISAVNDMLSTLQRM